MFDKGQGKVDIVYEFYRILITHAGTSWQVSRVKEIEHILACGIAVTNVTSTRPGLRDKIFVHRSSDGTVLFEDRIYSSSCSATNQISAFWITVLKNQSLWQTHLVWMSGWDLSINPWICLCYVDKHLNTSFQSGRCVWRCWAASKAIAWRKTSQELPLQDLQGKGFSTLPSLRFNWKLETILNH